MIYQHTQPGWVVRIVISVCFLMTLITPLRIGLAREGLPGLASLAPIGITLLILVLFHNLTVHLDSERLQVSFGIGLIVYTFLLKDIVSCSTVKSSWYNGWGIRKIRRGWLLNVSGYETVEIVLRSGKVYRIGTDDPSGLLSALESANAKNHNR